MSGDASTSHHDGGEGNKRTCFMNLAKVGLSCWHLTKRLSAYLELEMYSAYRLAPFTCPTQRKPRDAALRCGEGVGYEDLGDVAHALDGGEL
jgi:hypothetical protein